MGLRLVIWRVSALVSSVFALGLVLVPASPAFAHAKLESSVPAAGAVLVEPPTQVELIFSEEVQTAGEQVRLLDASGAAAPAEVVAAVGANALGEPASVVTVTPGGALTPGAWVVAWSVVSADGHLVSGALDFSVSSPALEAAESTSAPALQAERGRAAEVPSRVLEGLGWLAGVAAAMLLVLSRSRRVVAALAAVGGVSAFLYGFSIAVPLGSASVAWSVGEVRAAGLVVACALVVLLGFLLARVTGGGAIRASRAVLVVSGALGVCLFSAQGLVSGHHLLLGSPVSTGSHVLHLAAGATWLGAVVALLADRSVGQALRTRRQATVAVLVLIPAAASTAVWTSGVLSSGFVVDGWMVVLAVKTGLVVLALVLGLVNHRALSASRVDATVGSPSRLRRFLVAEVALLGLVVAASASLTLYTPPVVGTPAATGGSSVDTPVPVGPLPLTWPDVVPLTLDDGTEVSLVPQVDSSGLVSLTLTPDQAVPDGTGAAMLVAEHSGGVEVTAYLEPSGAGFAGAVRLPLEGHWMLSVEVPVDAFTVLSASGHVDLEAGSVSSSDSAGVSP